MLFLMATWVVVSVSLRSFPLLAIVSLRSFPLLAIVSLRSFSLLAIVSLRSFSLLAIISLRSLSLLAIISLRPLTAVSIIIASILSISVTFLRCRCCIWNIGILLLWRILLLSIFAINGFVAILIILFLSLRLVKTT